MSPRKITNYLQDMLNALDAAETFIIGFDFTAFENDQKTIFAVSRAIEIIGEASKQIPLEIRNQHSEIPWQAIAGMRDKMIYHYFGLNLKILWNTVKKDLPTLKPQLVKILETLSE